MKTKKKIFFTGDNLLTVTEERKLKRKGRQKIEQEDIDRCLRCDKPASECNGDCKFRR